MTRDEMNEIHAAVLHYGGGAQMTVCCEELAELTQAICKVKRYGARRDLAAHAVEEMADVLICIEELKYILSVDDGELGAEVSRKVGRLSARMAGGGA